MSRLIMVVEADDSLDCTLADPEVVAEELLSVYEDERRAGNATYEFTLVSAEWASQ
jgi:hypothetical protein